ncbi:MAG: hypothetical protein M0R80_00560 [Proteobacteria bacterium]|jgi:hypothetical protein|nr:hypothetical protein [Pseudomonadota bacterium]
MNFRKFLESDWSSLRPPQREFPFMHEPGYYRKAAPFLDKDMFSPDEDQDFETWNLYHVTTNLSAVRASGRLKSRSELGQNNWGLGKSQYDNPRMVSTTHDMNRARQIYDQMKLVTELARGLVPAHTVWDMATDALYEPWDHSEIRSVLKSYLPRNIYKSMAEGEVEEAEMDKYIKTAEAIYAFMQSLESAVSEIELDSNRDTNDLSVMGFAADFEDMKKIDPNQIAIIQVVARKDAQSEQNPQEREVKFFPQDLRIIRYWQP